MEFRIGNNIILGGDSKYYLQSPISGLSVPEIRTGDGYYAGVDGGYVSSQLYGFRTITLSGFYIGATCEEADDLRRNLMSSLHIRYLYPIMITTFGGRFYFVEGYIGDIKCDITNTLSGEFEITIICPDPYIYDGGNGEDENSAWFEQKFYKEKDGGYKIKYQVPVKWTPGELGGYVENNGSVDVYPIIILRGKFTEPIVRNLTTNKFIFIKRRTTASDEIKIDMKERIITLNGVSINSDRSLQSTWWDLKVGANLITLESIGSDDQDFGIIKYKEGYRGI